MSTQVNSAYRDVKAFHDKFNVPVASVPQLLETGPYNFRLDFMREELQEYVQAQYDNDLATSIDSLLDLVYVAYGTAQMMGVTPSMWDEMWAAVQKANMSKVRAAADASDSKRKSSLDVVKPAGWLSPDTAHKEIIERYTAEAQAALVRAQ